MTDSTPPGVEKQASAAGKPDFDTTEATRDVVRAQASLAAGKPDFDASRRVTMETVRQLEACRAWELAAIARRYAIDRPRWWHRFTRRAAS